MAIYNWRKTGTDFGTPADWINVTTGANPAVSIPGPGDTANFNSTGGGTVTGTGLASTINFSTGPWSVNASLVASSANFSSATSFSGGGSIALAGVANAPFLPYGGNINAPVTLTGATFDSSRGQINIGSIFGTTDPGGSSLLVQSASTAKFLGVSVGAGTSGSVTVTGFGSSFASIQNTALETSTSKSGYLSLGQQATSGSTTTTGNGTMTVTAGGTASVDNGLNIGLDAGSTGTLNISAGGVFTLKGGLAFVANLAGSTGTLNIGAGGTFRSTVAGQTVSYILDIGGNSSATGATGTVTVSGAGALLDMGSNGAIVGNVGTGTLAISNGGTVRLVGDSLSVLASLAIARATGSVGTVTIDGAQSTLAVTGGFYVARGGTGNLSLTNAATLTETRPGQSSGNSIGLGTTINGVVTTPNGTFSVSSGSTATLDDLLQVGINGGTGLVTVQGASSVLSLGDTLTLGSGTLAQNGNGALTIQSGGVVRMTAAADTSRSFFLLGAAANTTGTATVTGSGSLLDIGSNAASIGNTGTGLLTVTGGATAKSGTADSRFRAALGLGNATGSTGALLVSGAGSRYTASGYVYVGRGGSGSLVVDQAGSFVGGSAVTGDGAGANSYFGISIGDGTPATDPNGVVNTAIYYQGTGAVRVINASSLHSLSDIYVGNRGGTGVLSVESGSIVLADRVIQVGTGTDRPGASGSVTVQGGSTLRSGGQHILANAGISIGVQAGTAGYVTVTGTNSLLDANGDRLTVGARATGSLTVSGGAKALSGASYADTEAALALGGAAGAVGSLTVTGAGSQLLANGIAVLGGNNTGAGLTAGGVGVVAVNNGGRLNATGLAVFTGSVIGVDATAIVDIGGTSTSGIAGAVTIEAGATLTARGGTIGATLTGAGTVDMSGNLVVGNTTGGLTYAFTGARHSLTFYGESGTSTLSGFANGNVLDFAGQTSGISVSGNVLTAGTARFNLVGQPAGTHYAIASDLNGGTSVLALSAAQDYNADGRSDLVLQNDDGTIAIETQSGLAITDLALVGNPGATTHVVATADFNGDGSPDILVQNTLGQLIDYTMAGTAIAAGAYLGNPGPTWHVRGAADFDGDGKADIVVQNEDGSIVVFNTNGSALTGGTFVGNPGAGFTIEAVADLNNDGHPDLVVANNAGVIIDYLMNGTTITAGNVLANVGPGWSVSGASDYNGDGNADLLLHNDNGNLVVFDTNGTAVINSAYLGNPGPSFAGAAGGIDLNGDGATDLVARGTDGTLIGYTANTAQQLTAGAVLTSPGPSWRNIGLNPMQFIDGTTLAAGSTSSATAGQDQFDFSTAQAGAHMIAAFNPAQDSIVLSHAVFGSFADVQANEIAYQGGTFIGFGSAALVIQGVAPSQLTTANFVLR